LTATATATATFGDSPRTRRFGVRWAGHVAVAVADKVNVADHVNDSDHDHDHDHDSCS